MKLIAEVLSLVGGNKDPLGKRRAEMRCKPAGSRLKTAGCVAIDDRDIKGDDLQRLFSSQNPTSSSKQYDLFFQNSNLCRCCSHSFRSLKRKPNPEARFSKAWSSLELSRDSQCRRCFFCWIKLDLQVSFLKRARAPSPWPRC